MRPISWRVSAVRYTAAHKSRDICPRGARFSVPPQAFRLRTRFRAACGEQRRRAEARRCTLKRAPLVHLDVPEFSRGCIVMTYLRFSTRSRSRFRARRNKAGFSPYPSRCGRRAAMLPTSHALLPGRGSRAGRRRVPSRQLRNLDRPLSGGAFPPALDPLDFVEGFGGQIALTAVGARHDRDSLDHQQVPSRPVASGNPVYPCPGLPAKIANHTFSQAA